MLYSRLFQQLGLHPKQEIKDIFTSYPHNNHINLEEFLPAIHIFDSYSVERSVWCLQKDILSKFYIGPLVLCNSVCIQYCPVVQQLNKYVPSASQHAVNKHISPADYWEWRHNPAFSLNVASTNFNFCRSIKKHSLLVKDLLTLWQGEPWNAPVSAS